jgi:pyrroline-5-carboxylate reductase
MTAPDLGRGLGVLGGGHMGRALVEALIKQGADRSRVKIAETSMPWSPTAVSSSRTSTPSSLP